jgi:hypothetical protein
MSAGPEEIKADGRWTYTVGERPHTLVAEERKDRGHEVYLRWQEPHPEEKGKYITRRPKTGLFIRDDRGRIAGWRKKSVIEAADRAQALLAAGLDPRDWGKPERDTRRVPRTLLEGFREALPDPDTRTHVGTLHPVRDEYALHRTLGARHVMIHLGEHAEWANLRPNDWVNLWRGMAHAYAAGTGPGYRTLLRAIDALTATWEHLLEQYGDDFPAMRRASDVRRRIRRDWLSITGEDVSEVAEERRRVRRYSAEQVRSIFSNLHESAEMEVLRGRGANRRPVLEVRPLCDPRVAMVVEIGAELRPGQVLRAMRSHLDLAPVGAFRQGRFHGAKLGRGEKRGQDLDLHPETRARIDYALEVGYLSELEAAYQRGEIEDYPLYPSGKLVDGRVPLERVKRYPTRHLHRTNATKMWHAYTERIGVPYLEGRALYGLQRVLTDTAADESSDDRVLNALTGHKDSSTRKKFYMDMEREEDRAEAAVVRRRMRKRIAGDDVGDEDGDQTALSPDLASITADLQHLDPTELAGITALIKAAARARK